MSTYTFLRRPTHFRLGGKDGTWTACSLAGIQHRVLRYTDDPVKVTCRSCRRWMAAHP